jgi:hypothetical protein
MGVPDFPVPIEKMGVPDLREARIPARKRKRPGSELPGLRFRNASSRVSGPSRGGTD